VSLCIKHAQINQFTFTVLFTFEICQEIFLQFPWIGSWRITLHHIPLLVDHKLGKVPFNKVSQKAALLLLQETPDWVSITPIDINLAGHVIADVVGGSKLLDFLLPQRLLTHELVAGECQDPQPFGLRIFIVELCQLLVDTGVTTFGGNVHDDEDVAFVFIHGLFRPVDASIAEIVD